MSAEAAGRSTRRGALGRALAVLAGIAGLAAASRGDAAAAGGSALVLYGRGWQGYSRDRRAGELPGAGDRLTFHCELLDRRGERVGDLYAAAFALHGPGASAGSAERLELHTFVLADGTLVASGATGAADGVFAVVGGTGRYAGARGTYVARQRHELGGDGTAEFAFTLLS